MDAANNVIMFPVKNSNPRGPQTIEEVADNLDMVRQLHIQETLELVVPKLFENFSVAGFSPEDEDSLEFIKDGAMIVEAARSFLCKISGISHPLQLIAENMFEQTDEDGSLEVSDKIKIVITPTEGKS
jgi:hypothetical protein